MMLIRLVWFLLMWHLILAVCSQTQVKDSLKIGDTAIICITLRGTLPEEVYQMPVKVTIDTYAALKPTGLYSQVANLLDVKLKIQYGQLQSSDNQYIIKADALSQNFSLYDFFSVVVRIDNGKIQGFEYSNDKLCSSLGYTNCLRSVPTAKPDQDNYEPKMFISWIGTDSDGRYMLSHTKRIERFTQYSIESGTLMNQVKDLFK